MTNEEAVRKLEYSKTAYQMLIDEKVDSGKLVGKDVKGEWKADTPLDEAYKSMIEALEMGIKAIKALEQEPCEDAVSRQYLIDIATEDGAYDYVSAQEIANAPSVNPQPKTGHWISHYDEDAKEGWYECNRCHTERAFNTDFCPDCGARMVEPQERSDKE